MKRIDQNISRLRLTMVKYFIVCAAAAMVQTPAMASDITYYDWVSTFTGSGYTFNNTSAAGTIAGSSGLSAFANSPGTFGVPAVITSQNFLNEFQVSGQNAGALATFNFSPSYAWGSGGSVILGNIHNYFEYTISAWDFSNNPIDVNTAWTVGTEYPSSAPGTLGYFSTSSTQNAASGNSKNFYVSDPLADADGGQGGVLTFDGLKNVGKIELTLTSSSLGQNAQQSDFIFFNVGTPAPEPTAYMLSGFGLLLLGAVRRRKR